MKINFKYALTIGCLLISIAAFSQQHSKFTEAELAVKAVVDKLFDGMRAGDSSMVRDAFHSTATFVTTFTSKKGDKVVQQGNVEEFINAVGTPHEPVWDERISSYQINVDGNLASVWTDYEFYVGDKFSHCGVNSFQLFDSKAGWKIINITDTRRRSSCDVVIKEEINQFINDWHQASATADADAFFGSMTEDAIYIGTDSHERWLRDELRTWAKKAFERDTAWSFTLIERQIHLGDDKKTAWFNETLETKMGLCRSSGILTYTPKGWKIRHYHLSITVPNELIDSLQELVKNLKKD